jgi:hypothetical protein
VGSWFPAEYRAVLDVERFAKTVTSFALADVIGEALH